MEREVTKGERFEESTPQSDRVAIPDQNFSMREAWTGGCLTPPPFANPGEAEKAPWRSLQSGVAGVYSLLEIFTDSYHFPSQLTPSSEPSSHSHGRRFQLLRD